MPQISSRSSSSALSLDSNVSKFIFFGGFLFVAFPVLLSFSFSFPFSFLLLLSTDVTLQDTLHQSQFLFLGALFIVLLLACLLVP